MDSKEYTFLWFIENYSYCWHKTAETLISPVFKGDGLAGTAWTLHLYPRGDNVDPGWIVIYVYRDDDGPPLTPTYEVGIVAADGSTVCFEKDKEHFYKKNVNGFVSKEMEDFFSQRMADYPPEDILTIRCKLFFADGKADTAAPICARTRIGIERISFLHVVDGFSALQPNLKKTYNIYSAAQLRLVESCVYICTDSGEQKVMVEIKPYNSCQILAKCELYLLDSSGKKIKCAEEDNRCHVYRRDIQKLPLSLTKDAILKKKSEYLPDDKLSLLCECIFSTGIEYQKIEGNLNSATSMFEKLVVSDSPERHGSVFTEKLPECSISLQDHIGIYKGNFITDVILKTKSNSFPAHKNVLCARSPIFKVMMSNEKNSGSIQMDDLEDETMEQMLCFLYTDNLDDLQWETATKLYYAANKYQIEKLRLICSTFLIDKLTSRTATELLVLADTHSDNDLKKVVENFIFENHYEVFISDEWKTVVEKNPVLALNTMNLYYKTKKQ